MTTSPMQFVLAQIDAADTELRNYPPTDFDWPLRARRTAELIVPWLVEQAPDLRDSISRIMNSPNDVRRASHAILVKLFSHPDFSRDDTIQREASLLRSALDYETLLLSGAGGTVVSKLIEQFLIEQSVDWQLESNGASDYPDLFLRNEDYSLLPAFKRAANQVYGAAVKGQSHRPVRVPDGLEVKTCKGAFAVDCHHAHAGLHLVLLYGRINSRFAVRDIQLGFLRHASYRITVPATPTTTLKASFNGLHFISLFGDSPSRT